MGLPTSHFLQGLLHYYGITLNHLNRNSIIHLSIFVHLCEVFLGIPPSIAPFRYFFRLKPQLDATKPEVVGGAEIQFRSGRKNEFVSYTLIDSVKSWKQGWFYMGNMHPPLEAHSTAAPVVNIRWEEETLSVAEFNGIRQFISQIRALKNRSLSGEAVVASFLRCLSTATPGQGALRF